MYNFTFHRPATLAEAKQLLAANDEAKFIAGGMTLLPTMKMRLASPSDLIDLSQIEVLSGIRDIGSSIEIGAMTRHAEVAANDLVRVGVPALAELAGQIGDAQVRHRGTLGGSIANSDPAADYPAAILSLDAVIRTDQREIAADDFFLGMFETALAEDELIISVAFPKCARAAYAKFPNPASRYAVVGVMLAETAAGLRVAVTGAGSCAYRENNIERALQASCTVEAISEIVIDAAELNSDMHASADYRAHLVAVMARRAVVQLSSVRQG